MTKDTTAPIYVRPDNTAVITCPHCKLQKTIKTEPFKGPKYKFKAKCSCKNVFTVILEFRKRKRKRTNLRGTYVNHSQDGSSGNIVVRNISVSGLEFTSYDHQDFAVADELTVTFNLDDDHLTEISREVVIRDIRSSSIGCEFAGSGDLDFEGPLGYYVMH